MTGRGGCAEHATLIINPIIYAEVSIGFTTIEALEAALPATLFRREPLRPPVRGLGFGALQQSRIQAQGGSLHALPC